MEDREILSRISSLVDREHHLEGEHGHRPLTDAENAELASIEEHLDQCWDLLRQRRALREFGADPDAATTRDGEVVERYIQ